MALCPGLAHSATDRVGERLDLRPAIGGAFKLQRPAITTQLENLSNSLSDPHFEILIPA
jgi:hypothetical protein